MKDKIFYILMYVSIAMILFSALSFLYRHILDIRQASNIWQIINNDPALVDDRTALVRDAKRVNEDTVAWLEVPNTNIHLPVVQSDDNEFYLYHNFNKEREEAGWAFADFRNEFPELNRNTIIYGHTFRHSRVVFSELNNLLEADWFRTEENHFIYLTTLEEEYRFRIFSVYITEPTSDYLQIEFRSNFEYRRFLNELSYRSNHAFHAEITSRMPMLTLSTCITRGYNRLVVHAILEEID